MAGLVRVVPGRPGEPGRLDGGGTPSQFVALILSETFQSDAATGNGSGLPDASRNIVSVAPAGAVSRPL